MYARFSSSLLANAVADCSAYFRCVCQKALHYLKRVLEYRLVVDSVLPPPASTQKQSGTPFGDLISESTALPLTHSSQLLTLFAHPSPSTNSQSAAYQPRGQGRQSAEEGKGNPTHALVVALSRNVDLSSIHSIRPWPTSSSSTTPTTFLQM